jgi:hypothetical protein
MSITIAIIEDNSSDLEQIKDYCNEVGTELNINVEIKSFDSVGNFKGGLEDVTPDVMVVDLKLESSGDDRSGWDTVREILTHEIIPVIVYSAYSGEEPEQTFKNLLIARITKGEEDVEKFKQTLINFIRLKLRFNQEKERITKEFGKLSLETVKGILGGIEAKKLDENTLAVIAVTRLASYLMNAPPESKEDFPPESIFVFPPLDIAPYPKESLFLGDFLEKKENNNSRTLWLVISPSCDLTFTGAIEAKIKEVLLLACYTKYTEVPFLKDENNGNKRKNILNTRLERKTAKLLKCPTLIFKSDHILVYFKDYRTIPYAEIKNGIIGGTWKKLATLSTPYAESLQNLFIRDISRIGTPVTATSEQEKEWANQFVKNARS